MKLLRTLTLMFAAVVVLGGLAWAEFRFPMPEFESGYEYPEMHTPPPGRTNDLWDVVLLTCALGLAAWFVLKRRSRPAVLGLTVCSLAYFGFWREGCVCPVGSIQNVAEGVLGLEVVSIAVVCFFLLPLVFALFSGGYSARRYVRWGRFRRWWPCGRSSCHAPWTGFWGSSRTSILG